MAISYPLSLPTVSGIRAVEFRAVNAVAYSASPFTFAGQAHAYPGQMWQADVTLAPMRDRADAEEWNAFLLSLRGQFGTFLLGDPNASTLRGTATSCTVTGVAGANTISATVPSGETLLAGDYIQVGSGASARLHKVLANYTGTGAAADLEIWPAFRSDITSVNATLSNCVGVFRLASNETGWAADISNYSITFAAREAI
jgi:hypothetical protein